MAFKRLGILGHPLRPESKQVVEQVAASLREHQLDFWQCTQWDAATITEHIAQSDLVIAIGGDGAMLHVARLCAVADVPVFGVNAGHLGFLTEANTANWEAALKALLDDQFWIEERMMIRADVWRDGACLSRKDALNDVVISRGAIARSVLLDMFIDGGWTTTFNADGLIIATPTGSTAYALAVGGPILPPELKNILVVPVAAHLSFDRPLVLSEGVSVKIAIAPETKADVVLNVDGENMGSLHIGDEVIVEASDQHSRFIRLRERNYFYRSILDRMEPRMPTRQSRVPTASNGQEAEESHASIH